LIISCVLYTASMQDLPLFRLIIQELGTCANHARGKEITVAHAMLQIEGTSQSLLR
jgi:hypothetical protein